MSFICHSILPCRCQGPEAGCRGRESGGWCRHPSSGSCLQPLRVMSSVKTMMSHACPCPTPARQQCWQKWGGSSLEVASQGRLELVRAAASAPDAWEEGPDVPGKPPLQKDWQGHRQEMPRGGVQGRSKGLLPHRCARGPRGCTSSAEQRWLGWLQPHARQGSSHAWPPANACPGDSTAPFPHAAPSPRNPCPAGPVGLC